MVNMIAVFTISYRVKFRMFTYRQKVLKTLWTDYVYWAMTATNQMFEMYWLYACLVVVLRASTGVMLLYMHFTTSAGVG